MKKLPNFVKWLIIAVVLAAMAAMMVAVNDRASIARRLPLESESEKRDGTAGKRPLFASLRSFCRIRPFRLTNGSTFCILNRHEVDRIFLFFLHRNIFCVVSV